MRLWPFRRRSRDAARPRWDLSDPLLHWSRQDAWTLRDAVEGTLIVGATGSGKTSGSGRAIALSMLRAGFGGLVLTAKPDDLATWQRYCREAGREDDLRVFGPDSELRFSFLDYELSRPGRGAGLTENIVQLLSAVLEVAERGSGTGGDGEQYWKRAQAQLARNAIDLLSMATGRVTVPELYKLVISAPQSREQVRSDEWRASSFCFRCLGEADRREKPPAQARDFELVADFFLVEFAALSDRTRSVVVSSFSSTLDILNRSLLRELFCTTTNITPTAAEDGVVIVVDLPVKLFAEVGQFAQVLWKTAFQRSIERRDVEASPRPVFLWADEAQHVITSGDAMFQTTCRSSRAATCYLTQNISNVYAALGGSEKGRVEAASLFGNLNTKVFHCNSDPVTNEWASTQIGRVRLAFANASNSHTAEDQMTSLVGLPGAGGGSSGFSESYEFEAQPRVFTQLRTGGPQHRWCIDGIVFQNGKSFRASGTNWLQVAFSQR